MLQPAEKRGIRTVMNGCVAEFLVTGSNSALFDRHRPATVAERAVLVQVNVPGHDSDVGELVALSKSVGAVPCSRFVFARTHPDSRLFIGSGQAQRVRAQVEAESADLVMFSCVLSASQERNLHREIGCRVIDRVRLILDIFALRARTHEGKLQVELAQLKHMSTRLTGGWTHLERQKGGIGLRGPGEKQLETDRRLVQQRINRIEALLEKVRSRRQLGRRLRQRRELPMIVLLGYTNAGKSTLFNRLTSAPAYAADQLFATLDTTIRQLSVAGAGDCVVADTVGFIRHLPHDLVAAFRSTLEEAREADLLLHVVDDSDDDKHDKMRATREVIAEIGAQHVPTLEVFNKCDLVSAATANPAPAMYGDAVIRLSAATGEGVERLLQAIGSSLRGLYRCVTLRLNGDYGALRAQLFSLGDVMAEKIVENEALELKMRVSEGVLERLRKNPICAEIASVTEMGQP